MALVAIKSSNWNLDSIESVTKFIWRKEPVDVADNSEFEIKIDEINKRSVAKFILRHCGNEGAENDENNTRLRRLLQEGITQITDESPRKWKDAAIIVYDTEGQKYVIVSGNGYYRFYIHYDYTDKIKVHEK